MHSNNLNPRRNLPDDFQTAQVAFLEGSGVYLATALAFLRMHETGPTHCCIGTMMAHLDLCQSGMYEVDILLHQVKFQNFYCCDTNDCNPRGLFVLIDSALENRGPWD